METHEQSPRGYSAKLHRAQNTRHCCRGGHDTIFLRKRGYNVIPNEVETPLLAHLQANLRSADEDVAALSIDWRDFLTSPELLDESYEVLFSLGNAFPTYLFSDAERIKALQGLWRILKPGGTLFFDTRNYDYILDHAAEILKDPEHNFPRTYRTTYINPDILALPTEISRAKVRLRYKNIKTKTATYIDVCPLTIEDIRHLVEQTLGTVELKIYYDYQATRPEHFDFVQYAIKKP